MKTILRHYVFDTVSLYLVSKIATGMVFEKGPETLLLAGAALAVVTILIRPLINVLLLPINLITFGLFKWVGSVIAFYIVTLIVPGFKIANFYFSGFSTKWFDFPAIALAGIMAYFAFSFLISLISSSIHWLTK